MAARRIIGEPPLSSQRARQTHKTGDVNSRAAGHDAPARSPHGCKSMLHSVAFLKRNSKRTGLPERGVPAPRQATG